MAQDQGNKEDQFDFISQGESSGYISLDQARILAMRTARDIPGQYGRRFQRSPMAFDVVEANETEDQYEIPLSFRPQGEYIGKSGQEQFFIEKEGNVAHRQVLALPRQRGGFPLLPATVGFILIAGGAAVGAVFALGLLDNRSGADTTPVAALSTGPATPQPTLTQVSHTPPSTLVSVPNVTSAPTSTLVPPITTPVATPTPLPTYTPFPTSTRVLLPPRG